MSYADARSHMGPHHERGDADQGWRKDRDIAGARQPLRDRYSRSWRSDAALTGLASFGLYDITVTCGGVTYLVNVGITETGEIIIRSWQVVQ